VRSLPLFLQAGDAWYPAQAVLLAARLRGVAVDELQIVRRTPGTATLFWDRSATPLEGGLRLGLAFPPPRGLPPSVPIADLFAGRIPREVLQGRIAILGLTAASAVSRYPTPGDTPLAPAQITALAAASLLSGPPAVRPWWAPLLEIAVLAYFLLFALLALPRVPGPVAAGMLGGFTLTWGGAVALMGLVQGLWLWFWPPALLAAAALLCSTLRSLRETLLRQRLELCRTQGLALQARGLLDEALEKFLEGPRRDPALKALLCELAQEYERKRLFAQASRVYAQILEAGAHREARRRLRRLEDLAQGATLPGPAASGAATVVLTGEVAPPTSGRYEILRELGRGAMGTVYLGRDPRIDRPVAVKTLSYASLPDAELEEVKARFFREAQAAGKLSHPNIVTVFDAGEERDCAWLAMEYLEGATLEGHCAKDRRLPPDRVLEVGEAVAEALAYAHGQGVVHRDIKPANIMLLEDGRVKVTDFGIARIMDAARTRTGILMGTPGYMSPEQVAGKRVDGRSDLFSLGIVLYELLAGRRPFEGESLATVMARIGRTPHTPLREIVPGLPPGFEAVVDKLLAKGLNRRYRSADQAAQDLRRCRGMRKPSS
jgi:serine/threonine-protein kinase